MVILVTVAAYGGDASKGQAERIAEARRTGTCVPVMELPGIYPAGSNADRQFVYACWLSEGYLVHDAALGAAEVPDKSLVPALLKALERYPPGEDGAMICTTAHILEALTRITNQTCGNTAAQWRNCLDNEQKK